MSRKLQDDAAAASGAECLHRPPGLARHRARLWLVVGITAAFMLVEAVCGVLANSLVLLADAGHMLTDVLALALALFAAWVAARPPSPEKTFGYLRYEILAALVNGAALLVIAFFIVRDALGRLASPPEVHAGIVVGVAVLGLAVNGVGLTVLRGGRLHSLNVRGAYLHVLSDLLGSVAALGAGAVIWLTGWTPIDPLLSIAIALLIVVGGWRLVRESVDVLLEATPKHIALGEVERRITTIPGVDRVHDLHVWTVTSGVVAMSGHAVVPDPQHTQRVLETVQERLADLGISHVTVQVEDGSGCPSEAQGGRGR